MKVIAAPDVSNQDARLSYYDGAGSESKTEESESKIKTEESESDSNTCCE